MQRGSACLVFDVELPPGEPRDWSPGPLPAVLADAAADRDWRLTYFEPRVGASLFGTDERPARWHLRRPPTGPDPEIAALELLRVPEAAGLGSDRHGLAVLHVRLATDPLAELTALADLERQRTRFQGLLPDGVRIEEDASRAWTVAHATFAEGEPPQVMPDSYAEWRGRDQWLWLLASKTPLDRFAPDPEDTELFAGRVRFSADWQALVLRDGAAFVGTSPDPGGDDTFHATAAHHVHTLYLDVFLLARLQFLGANALANELSEVRARESDAARLMRLEKRLVELRHALWSTHITSHDKSNELLERFQRQRRLDQLLSHTGSGLADTARFVEAGRSRRTSLALSLLSAVGLPFGMAYSAAAVWGSPGGWALLASTAAALVVTVLLFVLLPPLRGLLSDTTWHGTGD
ncbi:MULTISPECIES: hypothetical protein [unclassified Streptomyces]|uniref:hypothetical protein n=1 Tax=unclassified Streptomyces TaxID=2593676 RepID=UPI00278BC2C0|nr:MULTISPECIES: hypothetical protein [unclassified Streptomyces]